jgi:hypothetical protein
MSTQLRRQNRSAPCSMRPLVGRTTRGSLQRKCACGNHAMGGKCEKCQGTHETRLQRFKNLSKKSGWVKGEVPPIVHDVLRSQGQPLDPATRTFFEPGFGHDFSKVRVHTDAKSAESADAVDALAYTVGRDVSFAQGHYDPNTSAGRRLITHELTHVVQQDRGGAHGAGAEQQADLASQVISQGQTPPSLVVGGAPLGLYRQSTETPKEEKKKPEEKAGKEEKVILPAPTLPEKKAEPPKMPSRLPIPWLSTGSFSLGLRLGFPSLPEETELQKRLFGGNPDVLKETLQRAKIMDQMLTGKVPSGWEETDKSKLASAIWGIFSTKISPDLAAKITKGLTTSTGPGGLSYELDLVLISDFSKEIGGGASFTVRW